MTFIDFAKHAVDMETNLHFRFGWKADEQACINDYRQQHSIKFHHDEKVNYSYRDVGKWEKAQHPVIVRHDRVRQKHQTVRLNCSDFM